MRGGSVTAPVFCPECGARVSRLTRTPRRSVMPAFYAVTAVVALVVAIGVAARIGSAPSPAPAAVVPAVNIQPTIEVRAVIEWPTATATATPVPTSTQQVHWQPDPCGSPEPGQLCRVPDRAPNTPTPYPSCYGAVEPGKWCRWIVADDAPDGRTETR